MKLVETYFKDDEGIAHIYKKDKEYIVMVSHDRYDMKKKYYFDDVFTARVFAKEFVGGT